MNKKKQDQAERRRVFDRLRKACDAGGDVGFVDEIAINPLDQIIDVLNEYNVLHEEQMRSTETLRDGLRILRVGQDALRDGLDECMKCILDGWNGVKIVEEGE